MNVLVLTTRDVPTVGPTDAVAVAHALAGSGHEVVLALLEDAVVRARATHRAAPDLAAAIDAGVRLLVDGEELERRDVAALADGAKPTEFGEVVDLLLSAERVVWL